MILAQLPGLLSIFNVDLILVPHLFTQQPLVKNDTPQAELHAFLLMAGSPSSA